MSERISPANLYQIGKNYDRHRLEINRIKSKSSPVIKKKKQQDSILESRHYHQMYNSRFKTKGMSYSDQENEQEIQRRNTKIISKILSLSKIKRPNSTSHSQMINRMQSSRISYKRETMRNIDLENQRFVKQLTTVKSTISNMKQSNSFKEHRARSQMLSKFKVNTLSGSKIAKNYGAVEKRLRLEPIHAKLRLLEQKQKNKFSKPIKFNSMKLQNIKNNPEISRSVQLRSNSRGKY